MRKTITIDDYLEVTYALHNSPASSYRDGWGTPEYTDIEIHDISVDLDGLEDEEIDQINAEIESLDHDYIKEQIAEKYR